MRAARPGSLSSSSRPSSTSRSRSDLRSDHDPARDRRHTAARAPHGDRRGRRRPHRGARARRRRRCHRLRPHLARSSRPAGRSATRCRRRHGPDPRAVRAAGVAARASIPRIERWTGPVDVVHATNYVAPPTRAPSIVSVYDLGFVRFPELVHRRRAPVPDAARACHRPGRVDPHRRVTWCASEITRPVRRATAERVVRVLPRGAAGTQGGDAGVRTAPCRRRFATCSHGDHRAPQEPAGARARVRRRRRATIPSSRSSSPAQPGGVSTPSTTSLARAHHRGRVRRLGYVSDGQRRDLLAGAAGARLPVATTRASGSRRSRPWRRACRSSRRARGAIPEVVGDAACSSTPTTSTPSPPPCSRSCATDEISADAPRHAGAGAARPLLLGPDCPMSSPRSITGSRDA